MAFTNKKEVDELVVVFKDTFYSIADEFGDRVASALDDNISDFNQKVFKDVVKDFNSLARISSDISKNNESITAGTIRQRDIEKQIVRRKAKIAGITATINTALRKGTEEHKQALKLQQDAIDANELAIKLLRDQQEILNKIDAKAGIFNKLADGVKSIPGLGPILSEPFEEAAEAARAAAVNSGWFKTQLAGLKGLAKGLSGILTFGVVIKTLLTANKQLVSLQRNLGVSATSARGFRDQIDRAAEGTVNLTSELLEMNEQFGQYLGSRSVFSGPLLGDLSKLQNIVGLTADQVGRLGVTTVGLGTPMTTFTERIAESAVNFAQTQGVALNVKDVLEEVSNLSSTTLLNLERNPQKLAQAVLQSRKLALNFSQLESISNGLLNFEDSIGAELEAELLTGKKLNLERARYAALTGDVEMLQREIAKNIPSLAEYEKMAPIQRQAYAKALMMSDEELGNVLLKNEAINANAEIANKLTRQQIKDAKELARVEGISFAQALVKTQEQLDVQQKFERVLGKIKEAFVDLAVELEPLISNAAELTLNLAKSDTFKKLAKIGLGAMLGLKVLKGVAGMTPLNPLYVRNVAGKITSPGGGNGPILDKKTGRFRDPKTGRFTKGPKSSRMMGKFGKAGKFAKFGKLAKGGGILSLLGLGTDLAMNLMDDERTTGNALLKTLDQNKFMAAGAGIGALFGGVGAIPGAAIGGLIDLLVGDKAAIMDDFIIRPGEAPIKFNKGDILMGGTNLDKSGNDSTAQLLERLIAAVEQGRIINLDGRKVNQGLAMASSKLDRYQ